ncbi:MULTISPECIES: alpha/beta hydrolase family protein [Pseudonocardia]|uniref:Alpha/beta hydrolase family protein n=2 Tax=Pseudonocardia TaxID=1847 RepID=A0A1Y2MXM1_PSEAH|nr:MULTISPECIES: alpha/beta hydrolase [Pseudonocardia]OSY39923.1 Alpha/beta hydrolase family protein [Pseudonocardia autotrophica]TDN74519.1 prolyl oligopeptidase family protein [Pseudonocardia autotrophica]BBG05287.1 lipase [Pseudonocardia autotrophica]GEC28843.1 lipase [Pseudonocardia saturnea]
MTTAPVLSRSAPEPPRTVTVGEHPDQVLDLWPDGEPGRPLVALVHGGFWRPRFDRVHLRPMAGALNEAGWPVASLEYRRIPGDPAATVADVLAGLRAAHEHSGPVVAVGHSAGGHLVLHAAATEPGLVHGTVALAPVADLALADDRDLGDGAVREYLGGPAAEHPELDPALRPTPPGPVTIVHGDTDDRVPLAISESYLARHPGTRLVVLPGVEHFGVVDPQSDAWAAVAAEIATFGTSPPGPLASGG